MQQRILPRHQVRTFLDAITARPTYIFSVVCNRRTDLYLRYPPIDQYRNGPLAYKGDHSRLADRMYVKGSKEKIILEPAGLARKMIVIGKRDARPTKHWRSKGGELAFNPIERGLYLVAGFYSDAKHNYGTGRRIGRHGQWRPFCMVDMETTHRIVYEGVEYVVN